MTTPTKKKYERNLGKLFQIVLNKEYKWYNTNATYAVDEAVYFITGLRRRGRGGIYVYDLTILGPQKDNYYNNYRSIPASDIDNWINNKVSESSRKNDYWCYVEYKHT
jgi:hypothetical protein